ncbi:MAG: hypothetical protein U0790_11405 [Isosphaeraceae bacterium]
MIGRSCLGLLAGWIIGTLAGGELHAQPSASALEAERRGHERGSEILLEAAPNPAADDADRLAEQLKKHPPKVSNVEDPLRLFLLDRQDGSVTLVADEPDPGSNHLGSPRWSHDGKRILYDAMRGEEYTRLRIKAIERGEDAPKVTDLGLGACPAWSPDDKQIAFLLNSNDPAAQAGIWVMEADGSRRRRAGEYGIPLWSGDNRTFLIVSFGEPRSLRTIDIETGAMRPFELPDGRFRAWPSWAGPDLIVTVIGTETTSNAVALVQCERQGAQAITAVLWRRSPELDVTPAWPVYSPDTRRCIFVGESPQGMALYEVEQGKPAQIRRLEKGGPEKRIAGLSLSPGGRFLLFCSARPIAAPK